MGSPGGAALARGLLLAHGREGEPAGRLFAVTSDQTCGKAPTSLDVVADAEAIVDAVLGSTGSRPDGQRVLYTKQDAPNHVRIATVGFDGTTPHNVADRRCPERDHQSATAVASTARGS